MEATATKTETVRFITRYPNLRVVIRPGHEEKRDVYDRVVREGVASLDAQFEKGIFETDDPKVIEGLISNPNFERDFWMQGRAPDEPKPTLAEQVTRISSAAAEGNRSEIEAALQEERDTHNRSAVILAAEGALRALEPVE